MGSLLLQEKAAGSARAGAAQEMAHLRPGPALSSVKVKGRSRVLSPPQQGTHLPFTLGTLSR